jgi:hypothetical protein
MDSLPHWLTAAVFAAGMTAYAEEVVRAAKKDLPPDMSTDQADPPGVPY